MEFPNNIKGVSLNVNDYNPEKDIKILIVFDNMILDMISNKKLGPIITKSFIYSKKINISIVFITLSYFDYCAQYYNKRNTLLC